LSFFNAGAVAGDGFRGTATAIGRRGPPQQSRPRLRRRQSERGSPRFFDLYGRAGCAWRCRCARALRFSDDLEISDTDQEENATASYDDTYVWLTADWSARADLSGRIYLGHAALDSEREGTADQAGISSGSLRDRRDNGLLVFETRWQWRVSHGLTLDFGGDLRNSDGDFEYTDDAEFALLFDVDGAPDATERHRSLAAHPQGDHAGAYARAQYELSPTLTGDLGLRFDYDTLPSDDDSVWSPRVGLVWQPTPGLELRGSWGRFAQSQGINELQISDGVTDYLPAQRAEHWMLGLVYRPEWPVELRVDGYAKRYRNLRPRFENLLNSVVMLPELKPDRVRVDAPKARRTALKSRCAAATTRRWAVDQLQLVERRGPVDGQDVPRNWDQRHALGAGVGWNKVDGAVARSPGAAAGRPRRSRWRPPCPCRRSASRDATARGSAAISRWICAPRDASRSSGAC
jgi:hypothetical protein